MSTKVNVLEFLNKHSRKIIIGAVALAIIALGGMVYIWWAQNGPIATVNGNKITKEDFNAEKENFSKRASFTEDNSLNNPQAIRQYLIERKLLDIAAKELSITVSDADVESEIALNKDSFGGDISQLKLSYEDAYGLSDEELKTTVYYKLLKTKVSEKIIATKRGKYIYARFATAGGVEEITGLATENLDSWATTKMNDWKKQLESDKKFTDLYQEILAENKYPAAYATDFEEGANSESSDAEKAAINKLQVGKYGEITKLDGYYAIYYLEEVGGGKYDSWDAFIKDYTEKYVRYPLISAKTQNTLIGGFSQLKKVVFNTLGIKIAEAHCSSCSGCDGYYINGHVYDSVTGYGISGATVSGTSASDDYCNGSTSSSRVGWCGYRTGSAGSDGNGYYIITRRDGSNCRFNCAGGTVSLTASKANYSSKSTTANGTNGSGLTKNFYLVPSNRTLVIGVLPAGSGSVTGYGINCGVSGADCSEVWAFSTPSTSIAATPAAGYAFDHFEAHPNHVDPHTVYTNNPLGVNHVTNWSIIAIFTPTAQYNLTVNINPEGAATASGAGPYVSGTNASPGFSGVGSNYVFNNWTGDCSGTSNPTNVLMDRSKSCTANFLTPTLMCSVAPSGGETPLVVQVTVNGDNGVAAPYNYRMNAGQADTQDQNNKPSPFWYTYSTAGTYSVQVADPDYPALGWVSCNPTSVTVTNPSDDDGGEVNP